MGGKKEKKDLGRPRSSVGFKDSVKTKLIGVMIGVAAANEVKQGNLEHQFKSFRQQFLHLQSLLAA